MIAPEKAVASGMLSSELRGFLSACKLSEQTMATFEEAKVCTLQDAQDMMSLPFADLTAAGLKLTVAEFGRLKRALVAPAPLPILALLEEN